MAEAVISQLTISDVREGVGFKFCAFPSFWGPVGWDVVGLEKKCLGFEFQLSQ